MGTYLDLIATTYLPLEEVPILGRGVPFAWKSRL
jgi:hypothetical protein